MPLRPRALHCCRAPPALRAILRIGCLEDSAPIVTALTLAPARSRGIDLDVLHAVKGSSSVRSFTASRFPVSSLHGPVAPGLFSATTTSADFLPPLGNRICLAPLSLRAACGRLSPASPPVPQVRTRCFPAQSPHLPPRLNLWTSLCCASSSHRIGLLCDSCSSTCRFRLAFLPPVGYPSGVGFNW